MINYECAWHKLEQWIEKEQNDMLINPYRTEVYYSGIACQTAYIKDKMDELERDCE